MHEISDILKFLGGTVDDGALYEHRRTKSKFVWIPIKEIERIAWNHEKFGESFFYSTIKEKKRESIEKYGGCFLSRSPASKCFKGIRLIEGKKPMVNVDYFEAEMLADTFIVEEHAFSGLVPGEVFDQTLKRLIDVGCLTEDAVKYNSEEEGNLVGNPMGTYQLEKIGSNKQWEHYKLLDFVGNISEWTEEGFDRQNSVYRGGNFWLPGRENPVSQRWQIFPKFKADFLGFRVGLFLR